MFTTGNYVLIVRVRANSRPTRERNYPRVRVRRTCRWLLHRGCIYHDDDDEVVNCFSCLRLPPRLRFFLRGDIREFGGGATIVAAFVRNTGNV